MNRPLLLQALAHGLLATAICGLALGLMLLPQQRRLQRSLAEGVISLNVAADGQLRLLNQPIAAAELPGLLAEQVRRRRPVRLRLVPDPDTPWVEVRRLLSQLDSLPLFLEIHLPAPAAAAARRPCPAAAQQAGGSCDPVLFSVLLPGLSSTLLPALPPAPPAR